MYQMAGQSAGALATTGIAVATGWVAAWTLVVAGLAVLTLARVGRCALARRSAHR